jgi:hypothetical protein
MDQASIDPWVSGVCYIPIYLQIRPIGVELTDMS